MVVLLRKLQLLLPQAALLLVVSMAAEPMVATVRMQPATIIATASMAQQANTAATARPLANITATANQPLAQQANTDVAPTVATARRHPLQAQRHQLQLRHPPQLQPRTDRKRNVPLDIRGTGLGLRSAFSNALFESKPTEVEWLEVHPENYVGRGGKLQALLEKAKEHWPIVTHGLSLGLANIDAYDSAYLKALSAFVKNTGTPWHSEHLCFTSVKGIFPHELVPFPFSREARDTVLRNLRVLEDALEVPIAIENVSAYATPQTPDFVELDFLLDVLSRSNAKVLLDVNNVYVNTANHGGDALRYIRAIPKERVVQLHMAGHLVRSDGLRIDTHGEALIEPVRALLRETLRHLGEVPILLERDANIPELPELLAELRMLQSDIRAATS